MSKRIAQFPLDFVCKQSARTQPMEAVLVILSATPRWAAVRRQLRRDRIGLKVRHLPRSLPSKSIAAREPTTKKWQGSLDPLVGAGPKAGS
jgi:hypothetical protein